MKNTSYNTSCNTASNKLSSSLRSAIRFLNELKANPKWAKISLEGWITSFLKDSKATAQTACLSAEFKEIKSRMIEISDTPFVSECTLLLNCDLKQYEIKCSMSESSWFNNSESRMGDVLRPMEGETANAEESRNFRPGELELCERRRNFSPWEETVDESSWEGLSYIKQQKKRLKHKILRRRCGEGACGGFCTLLKEGRTISVVSLSLSSNPCPMVCDCVLIISQVNLFVLQS